MNIKNIYEKPFIKVVEVEIEGIIASSPREVEGEIEGGFGSKKRRDFWE